MPSRTEMFVVLLVIGGLCLLLAPVVPLARGPIGKRIPAEPPDEARRIVHPAGFSMVVPPNWKTRSGELSEDFPVLAISPMHPLPVRSSAGISIMVAGQKRPPDLEPPRASRFRAIAFQDQPAWERMEVVRESAFDDPAHSEYTLYFQREGEWYTITYFIAERRTELPPIVREYINTFRIEPRPEGEARPDPE